MGEKAIEDRFIHGYMVTDSQETSFPPLSPSPIEGAEQVAHAGDLDIIEAIQEPLASDSYSAHDGHGGEPPWQTRARGRSRGGGHGDGDGDGVA